MKVALSPERTAGPEDSSTSGVRSGGEERALPSCSHELSRSPSSFSLFAGSTVRSPGSGAGQYWGRPCAEAAPRETLTALHGSWTSILTRTPGPVTIPIPTRPRGLPLPKQDL